MPCEKKMAYSYSYSCGYNIIANQTALIVD